MSNKHGDFIWYELLTDDIEGAQAFYSKVVGWQVEGSAQPGPVFYATFKHEY